MRETGGYYGREDEDTDDERLETEEEGLGLNAEREEDLDKLIDETQETYADNLESINDRAQSTINGILMEVDQYSELKSARWAAVLKRLQGIIVDYKDGFHDRADEDLEQLELKVRQIKNEIKS